MRFPKLIFIFLVLISFKSFGQVYQEMPQYGYRANRMAFDSTLQIPSVCGVPTLKSNVIKKSAIAFDTCNNRFYFYNSKTLIWDTIKGGGTTIDTTSLSNRINLKLNISDSLNMLSPYLRKIDTASLSNRINTKIDSLKRSSDSVYARKNGQWNFQFKDSVGSVQNGRFGNDTATIVMAKVHNDAGVQLTNGKVVYLSSSGTSSDVPSVKLANNKGDSSSANTFGFVSGTISVNDTGWIILSGKIEKLNTSAFSNGDIIYLDSISGTYTKTKPQAPYHLVYLGVVIKANAGNGAIFVKPINGFEIDELHNVKINGKVNNQILVYSDTQSLWKNRSIYSVVDTTNIIATKTNVALKVNISDTATMLSKYLRKTDTASLSNRINLKLNISDTSTMLSTYLRKIDTTNKFVNSISRTEGKDSIIFNIGGTRYAIKDSTGGASNTFSTGLTNTSGTITANLSTGVAGGQSVIGGTAASNSLTLSSTSNATKGNILFGTSRYDELNNNLGINTTPTSYKLEVNAGASGLLGIYANGSIVNTGLISSAGTISAGIGSNGTVQYKTTNAGSFINTKLGAFTTNFTTAGNNLFSYDVTNGIVLAAGNGTSAIARAALQITNLTNTAGSESGDLTFLTQSGGTAMSEKMRIFGSGNVGVGTGSTDAGYKLDVNGTARATQGILNTGQFYAISTNSQYLAASSAGTTPKYFRLTNAGTDEVTSFYAFINNVVGNKAFSMDRNQGFVIAGVNSGGNHIARAGISATNFVNTAGSESGDMIFLTQSGGTAMSEKMRITSGGGITLTATNTASGTTGNQTINKPSGTVNIAAGGTTVTVTNSLVTASSIVFAVIRTNDATAVIKNVVPGAGSFVINLNAATTAETSIGFFVIN